MTVLRKSTLEHMARFLLRSFPFIPGPELVDLIADLQRSGTELDGRIHKAFQTLQETASVITELEDKLRERTESLARLREEYERYSVLSELNKKQAKAFTRQLEIALGEKRNNDIWIGLAVNMGVSLVIFILGIAFGPALKRLLGM